MRSPPTRSCPARPSRRSSWFRVDIARMHERLMCGELFGVSVLPNDQEPHRRHFAGEPQQGLAPRFTEVNGPNGVMLLKRAIARFGACVVDRHACGDHALFVHCARQGTRSRARSAPQVAQNESEPRQLRRPSFLLMKFLQLRLPLQGGAQTSLHGALHRRNNLSEG